MVGDLNERFDNLGIEDWNPFSSGFHGTSLTTCFGKTLVPNLTQIESGIEALQIARV
jgi:hypothetical protein